MTRVQLRYPLRKLCKGYWKPLMGNRVPSHSESDSGEPKIRPKRFGLKPRKFLRRWSGKDCIAAIFASRLSDASLGPLGYTFCSLTWCPLYGFLFAASDRKPPSSEVATKGHLSWNPLVDEGKPRTKQRMLSGHYGLLIKGQFAGFPFSPKP